MRKNEFMSLSYDELLKKYSGGNITKNELLNELKIRKQEEFVKINYEMAKEHLLAAARAMTGGGIEAFRFNPALNIPFVGTGIGGATFELGNAINHDKSYEESLNDIKKGFLFGETIGAIPFIGKFLRETRFGKFIEDLSLRGYEKLLQSEMWKNVVEFVNKGLLFLSKEVKSFNNPIDRYLQNINNMLKYLVEDISNAYQKNSNLVQEAEGGLGQSRSSRSALYGAKEAGRGSLIRSLSTYNSGRNGQRAFIRRGSVWLVNPELEEIFSLAGLKNIKLNEVSSSDAELFYNSLKKVKELDKNRSAQVHLYSEEEYSKMRLFLSPENNYGFALKPDGDIVSVFVKPGLPSGTGHSLIVAAMSVGGKKLDAFDTYLYGFYTKHGFRRIGHSKWNDDYMPEDWDKEYYYEYNNGEPDVVYMQQWNNPDELIKSSAVPAAMSIDENVEAPVETQDDFEKNKKSEIKDDISDFPSTCPLRNMDFMSQYCTREDVQGEIADIVRLAALSLGVFDSDLK